MNARRHLIGLTGATLAASVAGRTQPAATPAPFPQPIRYPNPTVRTHDGRTLPFYDGLLKGRKVAINMMYTSCTGICPGSTANLRRVHEMLGQRMGREFHMVSLTLQPEFDDPAALAGYVKQYGLGRGWTYVTGKPGDIDAIRKAFGFYDIDPKVDGDLAYHTGMVRVGNVDRDRWCMVPALAKPEAIHRAIVNI